MTATAIVVVTRDVRSDRHCFPRGACNAGRFPEAGRWRLAAGMPCLPKISGLRSAGARGRRPTRRPKDRHRWFRSRPRLSGRRPLPRWRPWWSGCCPWNAAGRHQYIWSGHGLRLQAPAVLRDDNDRWGVLHLFGLLDEKAVWNGCNPLLKRLREFRRAFLPRHLFSKDDACLARASRSTWPNLPGHFSLGPMPNIVLFIISVKASIAS